MNFLSRDDGCMGGARRRAVAAMSLAHAVALLERSKLAWCADDPAARRHCLDAVKELNAAARAAPLAPAAAVSMYALELYQRLGGAASTQEKLRWLASKIHGGVYPPLIDFGGLSSAEVPGVAGGDLALPRGVEAQFVGVDALEWSVGERAHLASLSQDLLSNCSFVCAVLGIVHVDARLAFDRMCYDAERRVCRVQLTVNGCSRLVDVDTRLPRVTVPPGRSLHIRCAANPAVWWPLLLEKAYLTVMGRGYDFGGSNMALAVYMVAGWVPEVVRIRDAPAALATALAAGAIVGLGVGAITPRLAEALGLVAEHDYAVVGVRGAGGERELEVRNPWGGATLRWILEARLHHFDYLYINWDHRRMFAFEACQHVLMPRERAYWDATYSSPQVLLEADRAATVWLLLERHAAVAAAAVAGAPEDTKGAAGAPEDTKGAAGAPSDPVINLAVYRTDGERVLTADQYAWVWRPAAGTNNATLLAKVEAPARATIVVELTALSMMTLRTFSAARHTLRRAGARWPHLALVAGEWGAASSGGNPAKSTFVLNPQYTLEVAGGDLLLGLFGELPGHYYNVHVYGCDSAATLPLRTGLHKSLTQGRYKAGACVAQLSLRPGRYKVVVLTFERWTARRPLRFKLVAQASAPVSLTACHMALGLFAAQRQVLPWGNANRLKARFTASAATVMRFHVQHANDTGSLELDASDYRPALRALLFRIPETAVVVNEQWSDSLYGVYLEATVALGEYVLLVERFETGAGACVIDAGSSRKVEMV